MPQPIHPESLSHPELVLLAARCLEVAENPEQLLPTFDVALASTGDGLLISLCGLMLASGVPDAPRLGYRFQSFDVSAWRPVA